jgi:NAD(P)-dependent dehydrogenase (short-subunit alcohol dehydrogenase family)
MSFNVPTNFASRPVAVIGAGTLGRRIALMSAAHGAQVRIHDLAEAQRRAAVDYVSQTFRRWQTGSLVLCLAGFRLKPTSPMRCTTRGWSSRRSPSGSS